ncbi:MAG: hypothetical protein WCQ95_01430 [Bacteroidota bacterium]
MDLNDIATKADIATLADMINKLIAKFDEMTATSEVKIYTVNQLVKMGTVGGYDKIKTLIKKKLLQTTPDGKITQQSLTNYLKCKTQSHGK